MTPDAYRATPGPQVIEAMQKELDRLRVNDRLACENVGDWRDLHQKWQVDFYRAEDAEKEVERLSLRLGEIAADGCEKNQEFPCGSCHPCLAMQTVTMDWIRKAQVKA